MSTFDRELAEIQAEINQFYSKNKEVVDKYRELDARFKKRYKEFCEEHKDEFEEG